MDIVKVDDDGSTRIVGTGIDFQVRGEIARRVMLHDTAMAIEKEIGLDIIFSMISSGTDNKEIADGLGITEKDFLFIVTRTDDLRKRYLSAKAFSLTDSAVETLGDERFSKATSLDQDEGRAADHHRKIVSSSIKDLASGNTDDKHGGIIVNNTIVVKSKDDVPSLPGELEGIIDMES